MFDHTRAARKRYAEAHELLAGLPASQTAALAAVPQQLPAYEGLNGSLTSPEFKGYIDVSFSIGRNGQVRDIEFMDATANADAQVQSQLRRQLQRAPFRPVLDPAGKPLDEQRVSLRYHFAQI